MNGKYLGKIISCELQLSESGNVQLVSELSFGGCGIHTTTDSICDRIKDLLKGANVTKVSELKGKPVEVEVDRNLITTFRILTEVI